MRLERTFLVTILSFALLVLGLALLNHNLPFDDAIENIFYDRLSPHANPLDAWLWPKTNPTLTFWLHSFFHYVFYTAGVISFLIAVGSRFNARLQPYGYQALMVLLALAIVPAVIAIVKDHTEHFCPSKLQYYGGYVPDHYRLLDIPASELNKADCFPAAHPSAAFALMMLGAVALTRRGRWIGYTIGFGLGCLLSVFQMGRGEHFFSHCLATFLIALWVVHILAYVGNHIIAVRRQRKEAWQLSPTDMKFYES